MKISAPSFLIIDDDANDLLFLRTAFKAVGATAQIQTVNSGYEAVAYLKGEGLYADRGQYPYPDFILTDLNMPGMDGFGVLEFLKTTPESAVIPTIVLSGSQDNDDIKRAYELGASAYHVKPSSPLELRHLAKMLHDYWCLCEAPEKNSAGVRISSDCCHKLGERFSPDSVLSGPGGPP
jgi:CheY-like chemotaxis protein